MPDAAKSAGHVAFVGPFELMADAWGDLYWARIDEPLGPGGRRPGRCYTSAGRAEFALRMARLAAGDFVGGGEP